MAEKRPRVSDQLAARIDAVRGDIPFERWVNRVLEAHVTEAERRGLDPSKQIPALGDRR